MHGSGRRYATVAACALAVLGAPLTAAGDPLRVAIVGAGKGSAAVVRDLKAALPAGLTAVDAPDLASGPALHVPLSPDEASGLRRGAKARGVDAYVVLRVRDGRRAREVVVEVFDVNQPGPYGERMVKLGARPLPTDGASLAEMTQVLLLSRPAVAVASPPAPPPHVAPVAPPAPEAPPRPLPSPPAAETPPPDTEAHRPGDPAYALASVSAAVDIGTRSFTYHDGVSSNLRPYAGAVAPALDVRAEVYPFADTSSSFAQGIGIEAAYRAAIDLSSRPTSGATVDTAWTRYDVLLRYRIRLGHDTPPLLGLSVGYSREEFVFAVPVPSYPSAAYPSLRGGLDLRIPIGRSRILLAGDYDAVLSAEYVGQNFRSPAAAGVDVSVSYAFRVADVVELYAAGEMTRYFYSFSPKPGDAWVAGGAVDQMFHGQLGVRATY